MKTTSILSKKTTSQGSISINTLSDKRATNHFKNNNNIRNINPSGEKAIIINMFQNQEIHKNSGVQFTYVLKQGDDRRLDKNGVLRVYDMNEPINIPVEKLLGTWKNAHIGITLILNGRWLVKDKAENIIIRQEPFIQTIFQRFLKFVVA